MTKSKVISVDMQQIKKIVDNMPEDRKPLANNLYNELLFMNETMQQLKEQVREHGAVDIFKQGNNEFPREHPALTAYNKTLGRYNQTFKQMADLLPESDGKEQTDALMDFIQG